MAPSEAVNVPPAEIVFAQRLASNEPKIRRLALRKLRKYIATRSKRGGFSEEDLLKLWKGLHYCMWMQDKPLLQEELADNVCALMPTFGDHNAALLYLSSYIDTECREWLGIDKWRVDKFMMLFRRMFRQSLELLKSNGWDARLSSSVIAMLSKKLIQVNSSQATAVPEGLRFHLADIYLEELSRVGGEELPAELVLAFLEPWVTTLTRTKNRALLNHIIKRIFGQLIIESPIGKDGVVDEDEEEADGSSSQLQISSLQVDYGELSQQLFAEASKADCLMRNRTPMYDLVSKFKSLSEGIFPCEEEVTSGSDQELTQADYDAALRRLSKLESTVSQGYQKTAKNKVAAKKPKKQSAAVDESGHQQQQQPGLPAAHSGRSSSGENAAAAVVAGGKKAKKIKPKHKRHDVSGSDGPAGLSTAIEQVVGAVPDDAELTPTYADKPAEADSNGDAGNGTAELSAVCREAAGSGKRSKKRLRASKQASNGVAAPSGGDDDDAGDVEIWIPNKRYKGPLKEAFAEAQNRAVLQSSAKLGQTSPAATKFASFVDSTAAVATAAAGSTFFRKAASKVQGSTTSKKTGKKTVKAPAPEDSSKSNAKRVSFGKSSAIGDTGLKFVTTDVFKPNASPSQGVIKTRSATARNAARKANVGSGEVRHGRT